MHQTSFYQSGKLSKYPTINMCTALSVRNCMMTWYLILSWQSAILLHAWKVKKWLLSARLWLTCVLRRTDPDKWTTWPSPNQHRMEKSLHPATKSTDRWGQIQRLTSSNHCTGHFSNLCGIYTKKKRKVKVGKSGSQKQDNHLRVTETGQMHDCLNNH